MTSADALRALKEAETQALLSDLAAAKAAFQRRTVLSIVQQRTNQNPIKSLPGIWKDEA